MIRALYRAPCPGCDEAIDEGDWIRNDDGVWVHQDCEAPRRDLLTGVCSRCNTHRALNGQCICEDDE
jgi:hypothetical protein